MLLLRLLLGILKIIGIFLLAVLALVVLLLLALLFAPLRYHLTVVRTEEQTSFCASVFWLLHFLAFRFSMDFKEKEKYWEVRVFGINFPALLKRRRRDGSAVGSARRFRKRRKPAGVSSGADSADEEYREEDTAEQKSGEPEAKGNFADDREEDAAEQTFDFTEPDSEAAGDFADDREADTAEQTFDYSESEPEAGANGDAADDDVPDGMEEEDAAGGSPGIPEGAKTDSPKTSPGVHPLKYLWGLLHKITVFCTKIFSKVMAWIQAVCAMIKQVPAKVRAFLQKLAEILQKPREFMEKAEGLRHMLETYEAADVVYFLLDELKKLLRHYRIRKGSGYLRFGTGDPASTGELTGLIYLILPAGCGEITIMPEFNDAVFQADLELRGHIRLIHLAVAAIRAFKDKRLRRLIGAVRHYSNGG